MIIDQASISRVAVIDDDSDAADLIAILVSEAGFKPITIDGPFQRVEELILHVRGLADAVVCDHRLRPRGFAPFDGAEVVAGFVKEHTPALLMTQYSAMDIDVSIRRWRLHIPVLLSRDDLDPERISDALAQCTSEIHGSRLPDRRPWRTLLRVEGVAEDSGEEVVEARIPSWNPLEVVRFPASLIPPNIREHLISGAFFFAMVNIGAEKQEDLFFDSFELAPEPVREESFG